MKQIIKGVIIPFLLMFAPIWIAFGLPYWLDLDFKNWYGFPYVFTSTYTCVGLAIVGFLAFKKGGMNEKRR